MQKKFRCVSLLSVAMLTFATQPNLNNTTASYKVVESPTEYETFDETPSTPSEGSTEETDPNNPNKGAYDKLVKDNKFIKVVIDEISNLQNIAKNDLDSTLSTFKDDFADGKRYAINLGLNVPSGDSQVSALSIPITVDAIYNEDAITTRDYLNAINASVMVDLKNNNSSIITNSFMVKELVKYVPSLSSVFDSISNSIYDFECFYTGEGYLDLVVNTTSGSSYIPSYVKTLNIGETIGENFQKIMDWIKGTYEKEQSGTSDTSDLDKLLENDANKDDIATLLQGIARFTTSGNDGTICLNDVAKYAINTVYKSAYDSILSYVNDSGSKISTDLKNIILKLLPASFTDFTISVKTDGSKITSASIAVKGKQYTDINDSKSAKTKEYTILELSYNDYKGSEVTGFKANLSSSVSNMKTLRKESLKAQNILEAIDSFNSDIDTYGEELRLLKGSTKKGIKIEKSLLNIASGTTAYRLLGGDSFVRNFYNVYFPGIIKLTASSATNSYTLTPNCYYLTSNLVSNLTYKYSCSNDSVTLTTNNNGTCSVNDGGATGYTISVSLENAEYPFCLGEFNK